MSIIIIIIIVIIIKEGQFYIWYFLVIFNTQKKVWRYSKTEGLSLSIADS